MVSLSSPLTRPSRSSPSGSLVLATAGTALWTAAVGLLAVAGLVFVAWLGDPGTASLASALRAGAAAWLMAHGSGLGVPGARVTLVPLGLTALVLTVLVRSGAGLARDVGARTVGRAVVATLEAALCYAVVVAAVGVLAMTPTVRPGRLAALAGGFAVAVVGIGAGVAHGSGAAQGLWRRVRPTTRAVLAGAGSAVAGLVAAGALLVALAVLWHGSALAGDATALAPGWAGIGLVLLLLALLPVAVLWGTSYAVGTGFAVGVGTSVTPFAIHAGPLPAFPLLTALPGAGGWHVVVLVFPIAIGAVTGAVVAGRAGWSRPRDAAGAAAGAAVAAGLMLAAACWLAAGSVGPGRLAGTGPPAWLSGLVAAAELAAGGAPMAWWTTSRSRR